MATITLNSLSSSSQSPSVELWIDQRERHVIPFFDGLDYKKLPPYKIELRTLSAGDYAVVYKDYVIMLIERKSWSDLAATFLDRSRKFNYEKMISERNKFNCHLFYLIEGKKPHGNIHHVTMETLEAHLDHLFFDHNIATIYSDSVEKTPERLLRLIKHYMTAHSNPFKVLEEKLIASTPMVVQPIPTLPTVPSDPNCVIDFSLMGFLSEDQKLSASTSLKTSKKMSDEAINYALWNSIEGVTEQNFTALKDINVSLQGLLLGQYNVKQLLHAKYRLGTLMGEKKISKIIASAVLRETQIKVLTQVPSISEARASAILAAHKLSDIIMGTVTEQMLADVVLSSGEMSDNTKSRRLGNAAAKNIIKYIAVRN